MGCGTSKPGVEEQRSPDEPKNMDSSFLRNNNSIDEAKSRQVKPSPRANDRPQSENYYNAFTGETTTITHGARDDGDPRSPKPEVDRESSSERRRASKMKRAWSSFIGI
mmetsp:Transcript_5602/g.16633  ORF Transcript_5602/g.16633 Transcript_5602/m.16633 type:complete len:109 (+) Transcript_5602:214-540(+)